MTDIRSFPGLPARSFQHPLDVAAVQLLSRTPGLDQLARFVSGAVFERQTSIEFVGHCVRVDSQQYPAIYRTYLTVAERLDIARVPELYVKSSPEPNAFSRGVEKYSIVVHTGLLELMTERELAAVLAHELGHVLCDHMKYLTIVSFLRQLGPALLDLLGIPLVPAILLGAQAALLQWYQKSEFSADRAALLATQDPETVESALAKLAGYSPKYGGGFDVARLKQQAVEFDDIGATSLLDKALKVLSVLELTHPVPVLRVREIGVWASSAEYQRLLKGDYPALPRIPIIGRMRICPACGHREPEESFFCGHDGTDLRPVPVIDSTLRSAPSS